jgi:hypothetical protein
MRGACAVEEISGMGRSTMTLLAALLVGGVTWAEEVRLLDARTHASEDGSRYYVIFCARGSGAWITLPGHSFVIWVVEDAQHHQWIEKAYGFYPGHKGSKGSLSVVMGWTVQGKLVDEYHDPEARLRQKYLTHRLIVQVDREHFEQTQCCVERWKGHEYCLFCKNCKSFLEDVAHQAGLDVPCSWALERPGTYLRRLSEQATVHGLPPGDVLTTPLPPEELPSRLLAGPHLEP